MTRVQWLKTASGVTAIVATIVGLYIFWLFFTHKQFGAGYPPPMTYAGVFCFVTAAGLWFKQEWSRWVGIGTLIGITLLGLTPAWPQFWSFRAVLQIVGAAYGCWHFWNLPITRVQEIVWNPAIVADLRARAARMLPQVEEFPKCQVVILLNSVDSIDVGRLSRAAEQAFGFPFPIIDREIDPVDAAFLTSDQTTPAILGRAPVLLCVLPPNLLGVFPLPARVTRLFPGAAPSTHESAEESTLPPHEAFVEIAILPPQDLIPVENGHRLTCRLAEALADPGCHGFLIRETGDVHAPTDATRMALRSDDPLNELQRAALGGSK